ncbi:MAG TPA: cytochrome c [Gaiellaceae bacterium]|nr:cytochrome c [Gaiellaceae bacterium]
MRRAVLLPAALLLAVLALGASACGGDDDESSSPPPPPPPAETETTTTGETDTTGGAVDGAAVFASAGCGSCHTFTPAGSSGSVGPNLDDISLSVDAIEEQVRNGGGAMPPFEGDLSDAEIAAVAEYVASGG